MNSVNKPNKNQPGLDLFEAFTATKTDKKRKEKSGPPCGVKYTRVSSKEQFQTNGSIETQQRMCNAFAKQLDVPIVAEFGGTFESAKTEERKEFQRMMAYIRNSRENIKYIIVSDVDRFSRTGPNAIFIAEELRKKGIQIMAASSPVDTSTSIGAFQQNMQMMFAHFDNQQRREKTIRGMKLKSEKGYFFSTPPMGYKRIKQGDESRIVVTPIGEGIRKAFHWKADLGMRTSEIAKRLAKSGIKIREKQLSRIFRNVFYCGLLSNSLMDNKVVEGINWEPLVSRTTFLKANEVLKNFHPDRTERKLLTDELPLKGFISCEKCKGQWTGYLVNKKGLYYYKCNTKGCACNRGAKQMHQEFVNYLAQFEVRKLLMPAVKKSLTATFLKMNKDLVQRSKELSKSCQDLEQKIEALEVKYVEGDIDRSLYQKYREKYQAELNANQAEMQQSQNELSNPKEFIDFSVEMCGNLSKMWASGGLEHKIQVQQALFPNGLVYDRQNEHYRTEKINSIIAQIAHLARVSEENKKGNSSNFQKNSLQVPRAGIEPARHLSATGF